MRLIVGMRVKNTISRTDFKHRFQYVSRIQQALDAVQPWPSDASTISEQWVPYVGRTAIVIRSNEPYSIPERQGCDINKARVWAWTGILNESVLETFKAYNPGDDKADLSIWDGGGSFGVIGVGTDNLVAYTNAHRSEAIYWLELPDCVFVSNSAAALALIRGDLKIEYSALGIAGFIMHGLPLANAIPFQEVELMPAGAKIVASEKSDIAITIDSGDDSFAALPYSNRIDTLAESLVDYATLLSRGVENIRAAATGGKDSRLVLSALKAAGVNFYAYTNGLEESGEVKVGRDVAKFLGINHKTNLPPIKRDRSGQEVIVAQPEIQAWRTLRSTNGLGNVFTVLPDPSQPFINPLKQANFGGQGGEIIRGGFLRYLKLDTPTPERSLNIMKKWWTNNSDLLNPLAQEAVLTDLKPLFDLRWLDPAFPLFHGYITNRTGRWLATMRHGESVVNPHTTLLIDNKLVRRLKAFSTEDMRAEKLAHSVMSRLAPGVQDIPFFRSRWAFEEEGPSDFYSPETWEQRAPYTAHKSPRADFNWRNVYTRDLSSFFKDYLFSHPDSILFDVIDRNAVEQMLNGKGYRPPAAWALFSVQYMLNEDWLQPVQPSNPISINIPVPR